MFVKMWWPCNMLHQSFTVWWKLAEHESFTGQVSCGGSTKERCGCLGV